MFQDCDNLAGEAGTDYSGSHVDVSYAHIDGGIDNPGYLSTWDGYGNSPYVVVLYSNHTMYFFKDGQRHTRTGKTYNLNSDVWAPVWHDDGTTSITTVVFNHSFADARPVSTAKWFQGMENLTDKILSLLNRDAVYSQGILTNERHVAALSECTKHLASALSGFDVLPAECTLSDIRSALEALGLITGSNVSDAVIDNVFSSFCVGK